MDVTKEALPGKRVARSLYLHRDASDNLPSPLAENVWAAEALSGASTWNVVKAQGEARFSFLSYEDFDAPFPALLESLTVDLRAQTVVRRSYRRRPNPPVLHRKELLLPADDPRRRKFEQLTAQLERLGLLERGTTIGTRLGWARRLREAGVAVVDHEVRPATASDPPFKVQRHLAALRRDGLSTPIQALLRYGLIQPGRSVFDYGCGRGSDVEGLQTADIAVSGWDPYFAANAPKAQADVVNLGFVLNVIERPLERVDALRGAYALARQCLAVAVITSSRARFDNCRPYGDGYVTRLGTFQKYYQPNELKAFIEGTIDREALPAGPGLFFVFRDPLAEQTFLASRQARRPVSPVALIARRTLAREARIEALGPELTEMVSLAYQLGRGPAPEEVPPGVAAGLAAKKTSLAMGLKLGEAHCEPDRLAEAHARRRDELTVYFALNLFNGRVKYRALPARLQRDVRAFFGEVGAAQEAGRRLLFSLSDSDALAAAAAATSGQGLGWLDDDGYWIAATLLSRLPAVMRCYAGCAERYAGGLEEADVLKFHLASGKLTALRYHDFVGSPLPRLETRTKIDLRARRIRIFDHHEEDQRLLFKSRLMAKDQAGFERQAAFDRRARAAGLDALGARASLSEIVSVARRSGQLTL